MSPEAISGSIGDSESVDDNESLIDPSPAGLPTAEASDATQPAIEFSSDVISKRWEHAAEGVIATYVRNGGV